MANNLSLVWATLVGTVCKTLKWNCSISGWNMSLEFRGEVWSRAAVWGSLAMRLNEILIKMSMGREEGSED